ncbi:hypothetical protein Avi_3343 [Allorhizobium ampelinum S4]|uniref:Uncharacterized protein n=1 Tax=Allorhizobium ampelinum (strain ATCC BAA-846 / DSM 112012 / S4) TaxID=311402 RepID=B9JZT6_ALLAM|nr:hypothetical protein Avi_3343 [Allorhizobium ampelinum S4]
MQSPSPFCFVDFYGLLQVGHFTNVPCAVFIVSRFQACAPDLYIVCEFYSKICVLFIRDCIVSRQFGFIVLYLSISNLC